LAWAGGAEPGGAGDGASELRPISVRGSSSLWSSHSLFGSEEHVLPPPAPGGTPSCSMAGSLLSLQALRDQQRQQGSPARGVPLSSRQASSLLPHADAVLAALAADGGLPEERLPPLAAEGGARPRGPLRRAAQGCSARPQGGG
ncbi:unnamed protein product, partial [Prorocentrum cordatum]